MFAQTVGQRTYAFGLTWVTTSEKPVQAVKDAQNHEDAFDGVFVYYAILDGRSKDVIEDRPMEPTLGYVIESAKIATRYAAAQALAATSPDGLYIARLQDGSYWYCGVRQGRVIRDSDTIGTCDELATFVDKLSSATGMDVYTSHHIESLPHANEFQLEDAFAQAVISPLRLLTDRPVGKIFGGIALFAVVTVGLAAYIHTRAPHLSPLQIIKEQQLSYVNGVSQAIQALPTDRTWLLSAYSRARQTFSPYLGGFSLDAILCRPDACTATYTPPADGIYAVSPFISRYGAIKVHSDRSISVAVTLNTPVWSLTPDSIESIPAATLPFADWLGMVPVWSDGGSVQGTPLVRDLGTDLGAANVGLPSIAVEQVKVHANHYLDPAEIRQLVISGSTGGFVAIAAQWSFGDGVTSPNWELTFERVHSHGL